MLIAVGLIIVVMLQRSEGGALGIGGGGGQGGMFTARGTANALTRMTSILGAGFIATSLALAVVTSQKQDDGSVLDRVTAEQPTPNSAPQADTPKPENNDGTQVPVSK